jgi:hypothetical protein
MFESRPSRTIAWATWYEPTPTASTAATPDSSGAHRASTHMPRQHRATCRCAIEKIAVQIASDNVSMSPTNQWLFVNRVGEY